MTHVPPMPCIAHRVPECPACKASTYSREPVAWRFKQRIHGDCTERAILDGCKQLSEAVPHGVNPSDGGKA